MALTDKDLERLAEENLTISNKLLRDGLRNQFAAAALTGFLAFGETVDPETTARRIFYYADAMIAESEKPHEVFGD